MAALPVDEIPLSKIINERTSWDQKLWWIPSRDLYRWDNRTVYMIAIGNVLASGQPTPPPTPPPFSFQQYEYLDTRFLLKEDLPKVLKGDPGAEGASSYDLWLDAGNTGSVVDFLNSLKGEPGAPGDPGADGWQPPVGFDAVLSDQQGKLPDKVLGDLTKRYQINSHIDIRTLYDVANPPANFDSVLTAAIELSNSTAALASTPVPIFLPSGMRFPASVTTLDKSVVIVGGGTLVQRKAKYVVNATATPGVERPITSLATVNYSAQAQIGTSAPQLSTYREIQVSQSNLVDLVYGDQLLIQSSDAYPGLYVTGSTRYTYKQGWVHVDGLAINVTPSSANSIIQDVEIVGGASGAQGYVVAVNANLTANSTALFFHSIAGTFVAGESLLVNGAVVGTVSRQAAIITSDKLDDTTYATSPKLRKVNKNIRVHIDVEVDTESDPHAKIGAANRRDAIFVSGVVDPNIRAHFYAGYSRAITVETVRGGIVQFFGGNLANNPSPEEGAFGYATQAMAATEDTVFVVNARDIRHGFTTNTYPQDGQPAGARESLRSGCPKYVIVRDSVVHNSIGASFDTHGGAWGVLFLNCVSYFTGSGGQNATRDVGFANRAFGTIFRNCISYGATYGFQDSAYSFATPAANTIRIEGCRAYGFLNSAYRHGSELTGGNMVLGDTEYLIDDFQGEGALGLPLDAPYRQTGIDIAVAKVTILRSIIRTVNFAGIYVRSGVNNLALDDFTFDQTKASPAGIGAGWLIFFAAAIRFSRRGTFGSLTVYGNETNDSTRSIIGSASGVVVKIRRPEVSTGKFMVSEANTTLYTSQTATPSVLDVTYMKSL